MVEFETTTIDNVAWIVRVMPDGRRQRVGRQRDLDATVEAICAVSKPSGAGFGWPLTSPGGRR